MASATAIATAKRLAATAAVDAHVRSGMAVGIGSGSTVVPAIAHLGDLVRKGALANIRCVSSSFQSRLLLIEQGLSVVDMDVAPRLDVAIDGADEIDADLNLIKGGGGAHVQEKIVAHSAETFVVVADYTKVATALGDKWTRGVPVEVLPMALAPVRREIEAKLGGRPVLREAKAKAGPVVSDNGNFILDVHFDWGKVAGTAAYEALNTKLLALPGVLDTGFFVGMADVAYVGNADGSVSTLRRE